MFIQLFKIIETDLSFLFTSKRFKTLQVDFSNSDIDCSCVIYNDIVSLYLSSENKQVFLGLKKTVTSEYNPDYFGISVISEYFNEIISESSEYQSEYADFLERKLNEILIIFDNENYPQTRQNLKQIEVNKAKRLYPSW